MSGHADSRPGPFAMVQVARLASPSVWPEAALANCSWLRDVSVLGLFPGKLPPAARQLPGAPA